MAVVEKSELFAVRHIDQGNHTREYAQLVVVVPPISDALAKLAVGQTGVQADALGEVRYAIGEGKGTEAGAAFMLRKVVSVAPRVDADDDAARALFSTASEQLSKASEIAGNASATTVDLNVVPQWALGENAKSLTTPSPAPVPPLPVNSCVQV